MTTNISKPTAKIVNKFWTIVEEEVDSVTTTRNSDSGSDREYTIVDGNTTSVNSTKIEALIGWALAVKGNGGPVTTAKPATTTNETTTREYIDRLTTKQEEFTAHDLTQKIRRDVNNGGTDWDGRDITAPDGSTVSRVDHEEIRGYVHNYMQKNTTYERVDNGVYQTYRPL